MKDDGDRKDDGRRGGRVSASGAVTSALAALAVLAAPTEVHAYGGPGSIVSGIGAFLAALAAVVAAVVGFFWFPLKRLVRRLRGDAEDEEGEVAGST